MIALPSITFEEMSGSAKGVTAAKMKSCKYIRNRGYGGSVRTADQAKVKGIFKQLTTQWKSLSNDQILACGGTALANPPALVGVENPGAATIACQGSTFTFTLASVPADVTNLKLVIEVSEGQSNGVTGEKSGTILAECKWTAGE